MSSIRTLTLVISIGLATILSQPSFASDLAPANGNPKDVQGIIASERAAAANAIIAADHDRFYDLVSPTDGMTLGFGNWPQQEVEAFFEDMARINDGRAMTALIGCLSDFFARPQNTNSWLALEKVAGLGSSEPTPNAVRDTLKKILLRSTWMKRYNTHCQVNCRAGEPDLYKEQRTWFVPAMHYALRDRDVIAWQMNYWDRTVVARAAKFAAAAGMGDDEAAIVAFTALGRQRDVPVRQASGARQVRLAAAGRRDDDADAGAIGATDRSDGLASHRSTTGAAATHAVVT
jgi:hypothetical protein